MQYLSPVGIFVTELIKEEICLLGGREIHPHSQLVGRRVGAGNDVLLLWFYLVSAFLDQNIHLRCLQVAWVIGDLTSSLRWAGGGGGGGVERGK